MDNVCIYLSQIERPIFTEARGLSLFYFHIFFARLQVQHWTLLIYLCISDIFISRLINIWFYTGTHDENTLLPLFFDFIFDFFVIPSATPELISIQSYNK